MVLFLFIFLLNVSPAFAESNISSQTSNMLLAQNESSSSFDPFIDYGEFQDNVGEESSINFFKNGRSLNLSMMSSYEGVTFNLRQIYGDSPFLFGVAIGFFFDMNFSFQINGFFPYSHYNSLLNNQAQFTHYGFDLKYYLTKQYLNKDAHFFNPYVSIGPFWMSIKNPIPQNTQAQTSIPITTEPTQPNNQIFNQPAHISNAERAAIPSFSAFGAKVGVGFEIPLIKQIFLGVEVAYLYTNLEFENEDLSDKAQSFPPANFSENQSLIQRLQYPNRPELRGYRFLGDLVNFVFLLGVNF